MLGDLHGVLDQFESKNPSDFFLRPFFLQLEVSGLTL